MNRVKQNAIFVGLALVLMPVALVAQIQFGNLQLTGNGSINGGYNASSGDLVESNHGFQFGGAGVFDGSYYNPRFLSFNVRPYYNESRANSEFDSIYNSSGVNATAQIFAGSHFPGSVGFSDYFNKRSAFGLANGPDLTSNGNGHGFSVAWSELVPGLPTFTAAFAEGAGSGTVLGTNDESRSSTKSLNLRSTYAVAGFRFIGGYQRTNLEAQTPGFLVGAGEIDSSGKTDTSSLQVTHNLPFHGSVYSDVSRTHYENFFEGTSQGKTTADTVNGGAFFVPTLKSTLAVNASYSDSLYGVLSRSLSPNGVAPLVSLGEKTNAYSASVNGSYAILNGLYVAGNVTHIAQHYFGLEHANTFVTGTVYGNYRKPLFGVLNWSVSVIDNANQEGNTNLGLNSSVNATRRFKRWEVGGDLGYQQNVETLLVGYTESEYRYGGRVSRRAERWYWSAGFGAGHSLLTQIGGDGNHSENVYTTIGNGLYSANFNYSSSAGTSVLTSSGLQSVTIGPILAPGAALILYNARSYGITASANPNRSLSLWASYSRATSTTSSTALNSYNYTGLYSANIEYHARRLGFSAGYNHFSQGIGAAGIAPANVNAYFVGINRWFGFF